MDKKEIICIVCPIGCRLTVSKDKDEYKVTGNSCKRGETYGIKEMTNPTRVIPTTVKIKNGFLKRLPVKTNGSVPKELIFKCMEIMNHVEVEAPVKMGDVIIYNILEIGIDVVATKTMGKT
ncbi:DUF1667 domain-containing protein [Marinisporobacter balticus]|uniref:CxxC motif-containing protein n=1 Tax=Marinisporobacter balticus TaxID=2018667 RepID=A0A4R2KNA2_9FIRM|nr:DUF1667 domain-containing protein [Marinisporobacter balticus]TCO75183.1 CxxC motif-containing protein [Marinisporobacter balticus]